MVLLGHAVCSGTFRRVSLFIRWVLHAFVKRAQRLASAAAMGTTQVFAAMPSIWRCNTFGVLGRVKNDQQAAGLMANLQAAAQSTHDSCVGCT